MPEKELHSDSNYSLRAKVPLILRVFAATAAVAVVLAIVAGFYREHSRSPFRLKSEHTQLSTEVVADINAYDRVESENGLPKYHITADHAKTFSDDHQELENAVLTTFDADGSTDNKLAADKALFVPEKDKNFTAYLNGNVRIETRDALKINTNNVVYTKSTGLIDADEKVQFERDTIRGRSVGAAVRLNDKTVDLLRDVQIEAFDSPELARSNVRYAKLSSVSANLDMPGNKVVLNGDVDIDIGSGSGKEKPRTSNIKAARAVAVFSGANDGKQRLVKTIEFFDRVNITSAETGGPITNVESGYALYDRPADRFDLKNGAHIVTASNGQTTELRSTDAAYEQTDGKIALTGAAEITQGSNYVSGNSIYATLFPDRKVKEAIARGNAAARRSAPDRTVTVKAQELNAAFGDSREIRDANAIGASVVEMVPTGSAAFSSVVMNAAKGVGLVFSNAGFVESLRTDGRTTIQMNPTAGTQGAAAKRVTADAITTSFYPNGNDIRRAEAVGNAELYIEPMATGPEIYRTTVTAQRFDCDFFPTGNDAKVCQGLRRTITVRVPTVQQEGRGKQTLTSDRVTAEFNAGTKDLDTLRADGAAKFNELDRYALSSEMTFTQADQTVRLRGSEPTAWDSRYRAKAKEIDYNTRSRHSWLRGGVSTTYYNLKSMGSAAPFAQSEKPVFITSGSAEFDQPTETAVYTGNARGWQENNYVRGDKFTIFQREGRFLAEEHVQSAAYNARLSNKGSRATSPVFASAGMLTYLRDSRVLQYRGNADIRQGSDRITAASADVFLNENNEVSRTVAESSVVVTQPGRRATGDWLQYTVDDEIALLRGDPARVEDAENGTSQAAQLTVYMRDKRVVSDGRSRPSSAGRIRSTYKVQNTQ